MPSEPTLAEFAEAFEAVRKAHPGAPRFDPGYSFASGADGNTWLVYDEANYRCWLPDRSARDTCCTTAMTIGAWWEWHAPGANVFGISPSVEHGRWAVEITQERYGITQSLAHSTHNSLPSACLAALRAIADGGEVG